MCVYNNLVMTQVQDVPGEAFGIMIGLYAALMFTFEAVAECLSVWFDDPILGMLQFMNFWYERTLLRKNRV